VSIGSYASANQKSPERILSFEHDRGMNALQANELPIRSSPLLSTFGVKNGKRVYLLMNPLLLLPNFEG
jgi:hypothetical protein